MKAYISGLGLISPQETFRENNFPANIRPSADNRLRCAEPAYADYLNPVMARRMGRMIKMGIASAMICLKDAGVEKPDAIVTGTGLGCLGETEKFLLQVIRDDEQYLTPTSFIQSLQNSVAGQIALQLGCTSHNFTFVHKGFSFESALLDALMLLHEGEAQNALAGGIDEMTDYNFLIYKKLGHWKRQETPSDHLFETQSEGTLGGEGAAHFLLTAEPTSRTYARLDGVDQLYHPAGDDVITEFTRRFLELRGLSCSDIDLVIYGYNGDSGTDRRYDAMRESCFLSAAAARFKHLCGEYQTASGFALWLASVILKNGSVPDAVLMTRTKKERLSRVLIYNSYRDNHSLLLVSGNG
jgi:hypothetical protein